FLPKACPGWVLFRPKALPGGVGGELWNPKAFPGGLGAAPCGPARVRVARTTKEARLRITVRIEDSFPILPSALQLAEEELLHNFLRVFVKESLSSPVAPVKLIAFPVCG